MLHQLILVVVEGRVCIMADVKKAIAAAKPVAKPVIKAETAKAAEVKTEIKTEVKEPAKKEAAPKKETAKKAPAKKAPAKKATTTAKKTTPAKKATTTAKKATTTKKAAAPKETVYLQFAGKSLTSEDLVRMAKDVWVYDMNQKETDFKAVELYVKPEESMAYFVVNGKDTGSFLI